MLLTVAVPAQAEPGKVLDTLQLHGFLSQALVITDDNDFFGPSSDHGGSLEFTEIGANVSLRPHEDVLLAAQVLSRRAGGERGDAEPKLDYGLIDYQLQSNQQRNIGVQLGRFKNPFGFYNQTRDVAFTRPGILLPQSIYFDRTRSLALSGDGLSIYHEERLAHGNLRTQFGFGRSRVEQDVDRALGLEPFPGEFKPDTSAIGQIRYEHDGGRIITALSAADANADYDSPGTFPGDGKFHFQPWVFSFQYNQELWSLTAEYAIRKLALEGFNGIEDRENIGESWYLQYQRRFHDDWQWLVRYDHLVNDRDDPTGKNYTAGPDHSQFARDWTFGLQWTPTPRIMLAGEYHYIDGTGWLPTQDNPEPSDTDRYWNMLLFQVAFRF
ncbi:hypothetical protein FP66_01040 [Halomonas salina]|uniref:Porin n=2 Tax=Halomonas salina TaxID=42565 RepID=A0ABR4WVY8_9GAMM|nr:hypothetical protein FP66_01040 [Halomonas salina]